MEGIVTARIGVIDDARPKVGAGGGTLALPALDLRGDTPK